MIITKKKCMCCGHVKQGTQDLTTGDFTCRDCDRQSYNEALREHL